MQVVGRRLVYAKVSDAEAFDWTMQVVREKLVPFELVYDFYDNIDRKLEFELRALGPRLFRVFEYQVSLRSWPMAARMAKAKNAQDVLTELTYGRHYHEAVRVAEVVCRAANRERKSCKIWPLLFDLEAQDLSRSPEWLLSKLSESAGLKKYPAHYVRSNFTVRV